MLQSCIASATLPSALLLIKVSVLGADSIRRFHLHHLRVYDNECLCWCSYADALLRNLWRWLCSPSAVLTSPALRQSVASLMRKVLAHLVADMRKLGATIVAADMTSIILATGKRNLTAAVG